MRRGGSDEGRTVQLERVGCGARSAAHAWRGSGVASKRSGVLWFGTGQASQGRPLCGRCPAAVAQRHADWSVAEYSGFKS